MVSLFLLLFSLDLLFIAVVSSLDGFLLLILLIPWTLLIYMVLCFKGIRFSTNDELQQLAGRLYWISQGIFQSTVIAVMNIILGIIIVPDLSLAQFENNFGMFTSVLVFLLLPFPSFLILNMKKMDQEQLYSLIYQEMVQRGEAPEFVELTSELLTMKERYTEEYINRLTKVRDYVYQYIHQTFPQISPYFLQEQNHHLNLENLAFFITRNITSLEKEF
ncbi:MAG: hypothetical protein JSW11_06830 [Candidatus Heimdallarchaeota archaeon]|nr:MAG: hypothetical protein JSW11_06830 [Candidatus Heimdallarchaeota archaeon]